MAENPFVKTITTDQLRAFLANPPEPEACEVCWSEWNKRHGYRPGDDDYFPPAWSDEEIPQYDQNCPICVANHELKLALRQAGRVA